MIHELDDVYDTFYKDEEEKAMVGKESKDMTLSIMKCDKGKVKEAEHDHLKVNKVDLVRAIKAKKVDVHDDDLDTLALENKIKKLEEDFGKEGKRAKMAELKAKEVRKEKEAELKAKKAKEEMLAELKAKKAKETMLAELKAKKAKEAMLAEVVQISSDEDDSSAEDPTASTSTRSKAPIASTFNAKVASTTPRGYQKISMT
nr:hypothetical protein [Tanacetum cinerariifolium]